MLKKSSSIASVIAACGIAVSLAAIAASGVRQASGPPASSIATKNASSSARSADIGGGTFIYMFDQNGVPRYMAADTYSAGNPGHVYDGDDELVGTVPAPLTDGTIYSGSTPIGFIEPSPAYNAYFGG